MVWDGHACPACNEDITLEKELESSIEKEKIHIKRRALRTVMNENHDRFIHRFPPEIASQIFIQCCPSSAFFDKWEATRSRRLCLGAVCQRWRQLAWATPELWTSLRIALPPFQNNEELLQLVSEWLERSSTLPLTVYLTVMHLDYHPGDAVFAQVINNLNNHSVRWHNVHFKLPARHLNRLCGSSQGSILRTLVLSCIMYPWGEPNPSKLPTFTMKCKPSPTQLTLTRFNLASVDIFWNFITVASFDDISLDECIEFL